MLCALYQLLYSLILITADLDLNCMKNMENAATTALSEVTNAVKKSIEECKMVAVRAEDNYRAWYSCFHFVNSEVAAQVLHSGDQHKAC